jgi:hypothetical protein
MKLLLRVSAVVAGFSAAGGAAAEDAAARAVIRVRVPGGGIQPQAAVDGGLVHMIYYRGEPAAGDVYYTRTADGGRTFAPPLRVNSRPGSAIAAGNIRGAHIAVGRNGRVHVAWMGSGKAEPKAPDGGAPMLYTRLDDAGAAFEPERNVIRSRPGLDGGGSIAADREGTVVVAWHAPGDGAHVEGNRRVWVARSADDGATFSEEQPASGEPTGACGCCGMRAFCDGRGTQYVLYRSAGEVVHRDMHLLVSTDRGKSFRGRRLHPWTVAKCMMSSSSLAEGKEAVYAAWETEHQIYLAALEPGTLKASPPAALPGKGGPRSHPAVAAGAGGAVLVAWIEGMRWATGGTLAWQVLDREGKPVPGAAGREDGVPAWSLVAAFPRPDGGFTIVY